MDSNASVSVIIVTWNVVQFIQDCLESVFLQDVPVLDVIVVDNGSVDATVEIVKGYADRVRLIQNEQNKGFCAANNQALHIARGRYVLTLNSDIVLEKNYISSLLRSLQEHPRVGMAQGKFLRMDKVTIDGVGLRLSPALRFYNLGEGQPDVKQFEQGREIFGACAAAALYSKELFEQIKYGEKEYFDEAFFFLVEDFDVAWRARKSGWKAMYAPEAVCYHFRNSSLHGSSFKQYLTFRNRYFLIIKNITKKELLSFIFYFVSYDMVRFVFLLVTNPYTLKAVFEIIRAFPELMRKRRQMVGGSN